MPDPRCSRRLFTLLHGLQATLMAVAIVLLAAPVASAQQPYDTAPPPPDGAYQQGEYQDAGSAPAADPPARVARLSVADGEVSVEPATVDQFTAAEVNYPLTSGDRVWSDNRSVAEVEAGQVAVRLGELTDVTVTTMTDTVAQFGLGQGSVHLRSYALQPGTTTELDTPNVAVMVLSPGDVRVSVDPDSDTTIVTLLSGEVEVDGNGLQQRLRVGDRVEFTGADPVVAQWSEASAGDGLDNFSTDRDQVYQRALSAEQTYVSPDTVGVADLADYGTWTTDDDYGVVWYPSGVAVGWQPYSYGRWAWVAPWGWTWVGREPWGFAPFHYGRWAMLGGRWGWIPGPPVVHPVYSPGLVVFVNGGSGIMAWFPLGPHEPYAPWYRTSMLYRNRVNVANLYSRNPSEIRAIYRTGNREVYADPLSAQQRFANRSIATVAVSQASFARGKAASESMLRLDRDRLAKAPVMAHPQAAPEQGAVTASAARALPPRVARPTLASRRDGGVGGAYGTMRAPEAPGQGGPVERRGYAVQGNQPGRPAYAPSAAQPGQANQPGRPGVAGQPRTPDQSREPRGVTQPATPGMTIEGGVQPPAPPRGTERMPERGITGAPAERPLYERPGGAPYRPMPNQPQNQPREQRDLGRPLPMPQPQSERQSRPMEAPQGREAMPRPAPEPRSAPPPPPAPHNSTSTESTGKADGKR